MNKKEKSDNKVLKMPKPTIQQRLKAFNGLFKSKASLIPLVILLVIIYFAFIGRYSIALLLLIIDFFVIYLDYRENIRQMIFKQLGIE